MKNRQLTLFRAWGGMFINSALKKRDQGEPSTNGGEKSIGLFLNGLPFKALPVSVNHDQLLCRHLTRNYSMSWKSYETISSNSFPYSYFFKNKKWVIKVTKTLTIVSVRFIIFFYLLSYSCTSNTSTYSLNPIIFFFLNSFMVGLRLNWREENNNRITIKRNCQSNRNRTKKNWYE